MAETGGRDGRNRWPSSGETGGRFAPKYAPKTDGRPSLAELDDKVLRDLRQANELDIELYQAAVSLYNAQAFSQ